MGSIPASRTKIRKDEGPLKKFKGPFSFALLFACSVFLKDSRKKIW
ncbi:hypothetical protein HF313_18930 [Massilia atriviolacea]|nr:hypothetical protein [Massilia atriviolacea]